MQNTNKILRDYHTPDSLMLIAAATITDSAISNSSALSDVDTSYTAVYFASLRGDIDDAIKDILGADNVVALRKGTQALLVLHEQAHDKLALIKLFIETKFNNDKLQRDQLLATLGFRQFYTAATAQKNQADMGQLLSRFAQNLTPETETLLINKGLAEKHIAAVRDYAARYTNTNVAQEGQKGIRKELTGQNILTLNTIYHEVIGICKFGQRIFKTQPAVRSHFVFDQVVERQRSFVTTTAVTDVSGSKSGS